VAQKVEPLLKHQKFVFTLRAAQAAATRWKGWKAVNGIGCFHQLKSVKHAV